MRACLLALVFVAIACVAGAQVPQKRVLTLHATRSTAPITAALDAQHQRILGRALDGRLDFYSEYLDVARFEDPEYLVALREFLGHKYRGLTFDLILASSDATANFVNDDRAGLFQGAPLVSILSESLAPGANATGVRVGLKLDAPVALALQLQPDTREVFIVTGASAYDRYYENVVRRLATKFEGRVAVTYLAGLPMPELEERLSQLPARSIVYVAGVTEDGAGSRFHYLDSLDRLARAANAPLYTWVPDSMGHGIVGGGFLSAELIATRTAELALRVLRGEGASSIPVETVDPVVLQVDWRQLQRWGILEAAVPPAAVVEFRQPGLWDQYKLYVVGAISLVALQTLLISALLAQGARRRKAESDRRDLAGRLISAQEVERAHIARELHDDFGQRLASFSIAVSGLKRELADAPAHVRGELAALHDGSMAVSRDLRLLSHELHPGLLQHLGLVEALKVRGEEISLEHGIPVHVDVPAELGSVPGDAALCLYRVAQEALQNVVKHSGAHTARLSLVRQNGHLAMSVKDNGRGFDPSLASRPRGLGLRSLDERVRMMGGGLKIDSSIGQGTTVMATIPL